MRRRVREWGETLYVAIPGQVLARYGIKKGDKLSIELQEKRIILSK